MTLLQRIQGFIDSFWVVAGCVLLVLFGAVFAIGKQFEIDQSQIKQQCVETQGTMIRQLNATEQLCLSNPDADATLIISGKIECRQPDDSAWSPKNCPDNIRPTS